MLDALAVRDALAIRDLTDPAQGPHAMQSVVDTLAETLAARWGCSVLVRRAAPIVSARDNYDRLYYPPDAVARDRRYSRWIARDVLLRTQTSALIPPALDALAADDAWRDVLVVCPGVVYRRDVIDRNHVGEPHQLDLWRIRRGGGSLASHDLDGMIDTVVTTALPGVAYATTPAVHPYTEAGRQIDARLPGGALEVGECGLAHPRVIADAGLAGATGLAMGLGLDRLVMLRKGIPDIRLLRSHDPRVASQMHDLAPYRPVSVMPPNARDLSIAADPGDDAEALGDRVRTALGVDADVVESVTVVSETPRGRLPPAAIARLGLGDDQRNLLVRVVLRALDRTLTDAEANRLRDRIYAALHRGSVSQWATTSRSGS